MNSSKNFSLMEKTQGFKEEELIFITSSNKIKSILGLSFGEKINQVHFRQRLLVTNVRGMIILSNKKKVVGKVRQADIDKNIEEIISKSKNLIIEIAKFRVAASIDNNPLIKDYEGYTSLIKDKIEDDMQELIKYSILEALNKELMEKILYDDSEFFTNFIASVLKVSESEGVISLLQQVARTHGYKLSKIELKETIKG